MEKELFLKTRSMKLLNRPLNALESRSPIATSRYITTDFLDDERIKEKKLTYYELGIKKLAGKENDLKALYELAVQAGELARHEEAAELWEKALALNPNMEVAWFNLGYNLLMLSRFDESRKASLKALEIKPGYREVITNLAICELCVGSSEEALSMLEESLTQHPDDPNTLLMTGVTLVFPEEKRKEKHSSKHCASAR